MSQYDLITEGSGNGTYDTVEVNKVALGLGIPFALLWAVIAPGLLLIITKVTLLLVLFH